MGAEEDEMRCMVADGARGANIKEISGGVQGFDPERGWHGGLEEEGAKDVIGGADGTFGFSVLRRRMRARETECDAMVGEKSAETYIQELAAVITLHAFDHNIKLCADLGEEAFESGSGIRFMVERETPRIVCKVI